MSMKSYKDYFNEMEGWSQSALKKTAESGKGQQAVAAQDLLDYGAKGKKISEQPESKKKKLVDWSNWGF